MARRSKSSTTSGIQGNSGIQGLFGTIVNCQSGDESIYCKIVKIFNIIIMVVVIVYVIYYIYTYIR